MIVVDDDPGRSKFTGIPQRVGSFNTSSDP